MVTALTLQKHYLPLAELEPQLWYDPFPASAYQGMVAAQEEVRPRLLVAYPPLMLGNGASYVAKFHFLGTSISFWLEK